MTSLTFVAHPTDLTSTKIDVRWIEACGPLGFNRYAVDKDSVDLHRVREISAVAYYVSMDEDVMKLYNEDHFLKMLELFLQLRLGSSPDGWEKYRFEELRTRHYYPIYRHQYLYLGNPERQLLVFNPLDVLGYYPISADPQVWSVSTVLHPVRFEGGCVVRSESLTPDQWERISRTRSELDFLKQHNTQYEA
jgi:hypothetical protein